MFNISDKINCSLTSSSPSLFVKDQYFLLDADGQLLLNKTPDLEFLSDKVRRLTKLNECMIN